MKSKHISSENTSFNYLRGSAEFLNKVLNSISSCVLLLDKDMKLVAFNDAFRTIFSNKPEEHLLYRRCGEAIGCAYTVEEQKGCGETTKCSSCELRKSGLMTYASGIDYHKHRLSREFFTTEEEKVLRHLQYSTRRVSFQNDRYVILIVDDLTHLIEKDRLIAEQADLIDFLS